MENEDLSNAGFIQYVRGEYDSGLKEFAGGNAWHTIQNMSSPAIFLDRDGVLNALVHNPATGEHESPHTPDQLSLMPGAVEAAQRLARAGFTLFIVSNQPSFAKGKATMEHTRAIAEKIEEAFSAGGAPIARAFYCYHHPDGIVREFSGACRCRKPKPQMLFDARDEFDLDLAQSWMIGDQESDIECGRRAGCRTVLIANPHSHARRPGKESATLNAANLPEAVEKLLASLEARR